MQLPVHQRATRLWLLAGAAALAALATTSLAAEKKKTLSPEQIEAATRLQVFLDRANFGPGKLDGHYGDFTRKALALYRDREAKRRRLTRSAQAERRTGHQRPRSRQRRSVFISYTVTEADLQNVGELPEEVAEKRS